jgi:hypothetical protein
MTGGGGGGASLASSTTIGGFCEALVVYQSSQVCIRVVGCQGTNPWIPTGRAFLASGRECAVVDLYYGPPSTPRISCTAPHCLKAFLGESILAAATSPWLVVYDQ